MKVLLTGAAGYVGSTVARALEVTGHVPVVLDSLLAGRREFVRRRIFYRGDVADADLLARIHDEHSDLAATVHLAARVVVPESVVDPVGYYRDNVAKSVALLEQLQELGQRRIVFSSSAAVYAAPTGSFEVSETAELAPQSPYARTKLITEQVFADVAAAGGPRSLVLRYFNPIGSDPDLLSGVYVTRPSHVLGQLVSADEGLADGFTITGTDYPTRDGTGIRDYVHVWDVALAHVAALERFDKVVTATSPSVAVNVGTGRGTTVRELVSAFQQVTGRHLQVREAPARPGDAVGAYADVHRAHHLLGWRARHSLREGIASALAWHARRHQVLGSDARP